MWLVGENQRTTVILTLIASISFHQAGSFVAPPSKPTAAVSVPLFDNDDDHTYLARDKCVRKQQLSTTRCKMCVRATTTAVLSYTIESFSRGLSCVLESRQNTKHMHGVVVAVDSK